MDLLIQRQIVIPFGRAVYQVRVLVLQQQGGQLDIAALGGGVEKSGEGVCVD